MACLPLKQCFGAEVTLFKKVSLLRTEFRFRSVTKLVLHISLGKKLNHYPKEPNSSKSRKVTNAPSRIPTFTRRSPSEGGSTLILFAQLTTLIPPPKPKPRREHIDLINHIDHINLYFSTFPKAYRAKSRGRLQNSFRRSQCRFYPQFPARSSCDQA